MGYLLEFAILNWYMFVWGMLWVHFAGMVKLCKCFFDILWHGYIYVSQIIVPVEVESAVMSTMWIDCVFEGGPDGVTEVLGIFLRPEFDAEIIYTKTELCWLGLMLPESYRSLDGIVTIWRKGILEVFICQECCLFET